MPTNILATVGAFDEHTRSVEILASTPKLVDGEALVTWDLERFRKNPVILWVHDGDRMPIGRAEDVRVDDEGLKMRVVFATEKVTPLAEQAWNGVKENVLRTVSVGFEPGRATTSTIDGKKVKTRTANELLEVSFVPVPKDEDAGILTPEARGKRASAAASELARHRLKRSDAGDVVERVDAVGRLGKVERTPLGGARIPARLSRTGVLAYRNPDGSERRELRLPAEVFKADSLATLEDVPVVDIGDHKGLVTPDTYRRVSLGHVKSARQDGKYIVSELVIQDQVTLDAIERGERTEISCGYECSLDPSPGVYEGEHYDAVQRNIRYNHVALCPPNRGRAGPDVGLRLDSEGERDMPRIIRIDGTDFEFGSDAHIAKLESDHKATLAALQKRLDEAEGEKDAAQEEARKAREEADGAKAAADEERKKRETDEEQKVREGTRIRRRAERLVAAAREEEQEQEGESSPPSTDEERTKREEERKKREEDVEKKMDGLSARDVMVLAIQAHHKNFDAKGKSEDYVRARFDALEEAVRERRGINGVARTAHDLLRRLDSNDGEDIVAKARRERDEAALNAWKRTQNGGK